MTSAIETVGIYLTEDERRLLTSLASDLECREESALRRSEGPEAQTYGATREALRKLMHLPAVQAVDAARMRSVVRGVAFEEIDLKTTWPTNRIEPLAEAIADRVVTLLTGVTP